MISNDGLTEPSAKLLLIAAVLANEKIISNNSKSFLKDVILRRDPELAALLKNFESKSSQVNTFLEKIHEVIKQEAELVYNDIFSDTPIEVGKNLSKKERDRKKLHTEKSLIYGEVEFRSFYDILRTISPPKGAVFYDLGSGTGKAVFAALLTQDFSRCVGVEILDDLHMQATKVTDRYKQVDYPHSYGVSQTVQVHRGSFLDFDWSDGDVVFANSTCFEDSLMNDLGKAAEALKPGAIVVTFTKSLTSKAFEVIDKRRHKMSWGPATVFIHRRLRLDGRPVGPVTLNRLASDRDYNGDDTPSPRSSDQLSLSANTVGDSDDDEQPLPPPPNTDSPQVSASGSRSVMDAIGSPQDSALLRRKRVSHPPPPPGSTSPAPSRNHADIMGSPQDSALMRRKRATRESTAPPEGSTSPERPTKDAYGIDIMSSPQGSALMRRKHAPKP